MKKIIFCGWLMVYMLMSVTAQDSAFSFEDVKTWVGEGSNRAVLVVDWNSEKKEQALVWGFRWNGEATGYDMLAAVAKEDPRFVLLAEESIYGNTVAGLGFNPRSPYQTKLIYDRNGEAVGYTPADGVVMADSNDYGNWSCSDTAALWQAEHWTVGYWSYYVKDQAEDDFGYASTGATGRQLTDGCVDGYSFALVSDTTTGGVPRMPYEFVLPYADTMIAVTGVSLDKQAAELTVGAGPLQLTATVTPAQAVNKDVVWLSTDQAVATVSVGGLVTPVSAGEARIVVKTVDGGFADTCVVRVKENVANESALPVVLGRIYPNPAVEVANVEVCRDAVLEVFDLNGRTVFRKQVSAGIQTIALDKSGVYLVRVSAGDRVYVKRLVKR